MTATGSTTIGGRAVPVEIERLYVVPDKMRIDATLNGQVKVTVAVDGRRGWQLAPDQTGAKMQLSDIGGAEIASIDFERWREPELILVKAADPAARIWTAPDEAIDGKPHAVVKLRAPYGGVDVALYLDKKTKLLTRMTYSEGAGTETDDFADYKPVQGVMISHKRHSTGRDRTTQLDIKTVEIDPKVDAKAFAKPDAPK